MKFQFHLDGAGSAECEIKINSKNFTFGAGYLTNAFGNLLQALVKINPLYTEEAYIKNGANFFWDDEPSGTTWHFKPLEAGKMFLEVISYKDLGSRKGPKIEIQSKCSYDEFLLEVVKEAERILNEYGIVGYKEMWIEDEFPLSSFLKLKFYIENKEKFPVDSKEIGYSEIHKSNLKMELNYLSK